MADKKITQLDAVTSIANTDLLLIVRDPSTSPVNKKLEIGDLFGETSQSVVSNINLRATNTAGLTVNTLTIASNNQTTITRGLIVNEDGVASDTRIESDAYPYMFFVDSANNRIGLNASDPQQVLDINSNAIRLRSTNTPASSNNLVVNWPVGTIAWDTGYLYIAIDASTIKRIALGTF